MIWAVLAFLGVPLWLCAVGLFTVLLRTRRLSGRAGNIPVRVLRPGHTRWTRGNAVWVSDVFAWRGIPAAWAEDLVHVVDLRERPATPDEATKLRRLGDGPAVVELRGPDGEPVTVATAGSARAALVGPYAATDTMPGGPRPREGLRPDSR